MTKWEEKILTSFADRFPSSAAAVGGREIRIKVRSVFPELQSSGPDPIESFLEAAESLERDGLVRITWQRHRKREEIESLTLKDPPELYKRLGKPSPLAVLDEARMRARLEVAESGTYQPFFSFLYENLSPEDASAGMDADFITGLRCIFNALEERGKDTELHGITPRALSILLFSESKRLEAIVHHAKPILQRASDAGIEVPDLSVLNRNFPDTLIAGRIELDFGIQPALANSAGLPLGIPGQTARSIRSIRLLEPGMERSVLFVENKETFYALSGKDTSYSCLVYTAGHPNPAVIILARALVQSGFTLHHAGDLDPDGILILQELSESAGASVIPHRMDESTFDQYLPWAYELDAVRLSRLSRLKDVTRQLKGIEKLVERIQDTRKGVEQEIIEY